MKKTKALVVFSGGLDSILAVKTLQAQNIEVTALCFESNFYNADNAKKSASDLGVDLIIRDISKEMLALVKNPPNGYGKNMNPCIDCHATMFRLAGGIMREKGFDLIASGEVLGQRPFSQVKESLQRVRDAAGIEILRPLSAKLLPETEYEKNGLLRRGLLHRLQGRSREGQMELAKKYGISDYPSPAGGCLLTDPEFSSRLVKLLDAWPDCDENDVELIKNGRVFWFDGSGSKKLLAVVGRNQQENENLEKNSKKNDVILRLKDYMGPSTLVRGLDIDSEKEIKLLIPENLSQIDLTEKDEDKIIKTIAAISGFYAVKCRGLEAIICLEKV